MTVALSMLWPAGGVSGIDVARPVIHLIHLIHLKN
jgi:hypothetical protein